MIRTFSMFGLGGLFLAISPKLRDQVQAAIGSAASAMNAYSPFSYVAGGILVLATMVYSFNRSSRAR